MRVDIIHWRHRQNAPYPLQQQHIPPEQNPWGNPAPIPPPQPEDTDNDENGVENGGENSSGGSNNMEEQEEPIADWEAQSEGTELPTIVQEPRPVQGVDMKSKGVAWKLKSRIKVRKMWTKKKIVHATHKLTPGVPQAEGMKDVRFFFYRCQKISRGFSNLGHKCKYGIGSGKPDILRKSVAKEGSGL